MTDKKGPVSKRPYQLIKPIPRAKYPALTEAEELISVPLQTLCQAIFDAVLVYILNDVHIQRHLASQRDETRDARERGPDSIGEWGFRFQKPSPRSR